MYGRQFKHLPLLRQLNLPADETHGNESSDEDIKFEADENTSNWILDLEHSRTTDREIAQVNIKTEQVQQKRIYDQKVQTNRFLLHNV